MTGPSRSPRPTCSHRTPGVRTDEFRAPPGSDPAYRDTEHDVREPMATNALPPVVDEATWQRELDALRVREKAATRELDAIAAQRRRLPAVAMPEYTLEGPAGPGGLPPHLRGGPPQNIYKPTLCSPETRHFGGCAS